MLNAPEFFKVTSIIDPQLVRQYGCSLKSRSYKCDLRDLSRDSK
jgi:hypothetical protein